MKNICSATIDTIFDNSEKYPISSFFVNALYVSMEQLSYAEENGGDDSEKIITSLQNMIDIYADLLNKSYKLEYDKNEQLSSDWSIG